jgi:tetratricopeptide (TPR) repeat protein
LKSRDRINKGVAAFKNAQYEEAVSDFQEAVQLDPTSKNAKMYLATSYAYQVVPDLMEPANLHLAQEALDGFNGVLANGPDQPDCAQADRFDRPQHREVRPGEAGRAEGDFAGAERPRSLLHRRVRGLEAGV